jgi:hypothetical protein
LNRVAIAKEMKNEGEVKLQKRRVLLLLASTTPAPQMTSLAAQEHFYN